MDLQKTALETGIPAMYLEKEIRLFAATPVIFSRLQENRITAALYGGTALNKGFFKEKQRFSKDLNIECRASEIVKLLSAISLSCEPAFRVQAEHGNNWGLAKLSYGRQPWENLLVELKPLKRKPDIKQVGLHSILEYAGTPMPPVFVPSYSLEELFARKIVALSNRAIGKDLYDTFIASQLEFDERLLKRKLKEISLSEKKTARKVIENAVYWTSKIRGSNAEELMETIPLAYRTGLGEMAKSVSLFLNKLSAHAL